MSRLFNKIIGWSVSLMLLSLTKTAAADANGALKGPSPIVLSRVFASRIPEAEGTWASLQLGAFKWDVESRLMVRSSERVKRVRLLADQMAKYKICPDWTLPSAEEFDRAGVNFCDGQIVGNLYFDLNSGKLVWKSLDTTSAIGSLDLVADDELRKTAVWAFERIKKPGAEDWYLARHIVDFLTMRDCSAVLNEEQKLLVTNSVREWVEGREERYFSGLETLARTMQKEILHKVEDGNVSTRAEVYRRIQNSAEFAFFLFRKDFTTTGKSKSP